jgi:murein L,D-transpeptidase YcbB/YkuD
MGFFRRATAEESSFYKKLQEQKRINKRAARERAQMARIDARKQKLLKNTLRNERMKAELKDLSAKKAERRLVKEYRREKYAPIYSATSAAKTAYKNLQKKKLQAASIGTKKLGKKKRGTLAQQPVSAYDPFAVRKEPGFTTGQTKVYEERKDYDPFGMSDK